MSDWVPTHDRQHPPFEPGNEFAMTHGARSEGRVGPLAERILAELMADPTTPEYLVHDRSYGHSLMAWSRAEAKVMLIDAHIDAVGMETAYAGRGLLLEQSRKWAVTASNLRTRLGLDPVSRAKILRDLAAVRFLSGPSALDAALDERARARELEGGVYEP